MRKEVGKGKFTLDGEQSKEQLCMCEAVGALESGSEFQANHKLDAGSDCHLGQHNQVALASCPVLHHRTFGIPRRHHPREEEKQAAEEDRKKLRRKIMSTSRRGVTAAAAAAAAAAAPDPNDYLTWLVKSVCELGEETTENGGLQILLPDDPYVGCPEGSFLRKIGVSDAMPYNNIDQADTQMCDSVALVDRAGAPLYVHTFDYAPFNEFNQHSGSDGYDVYVVQDGVVSISNTKDGGSYGSTFMATTATSVRAGRSFRHRAS
jgi:hypothetical protein